MPLTDYLLAALSTDDEEVRDALADMADEEVTEGGADGLGDPTGQAAKRVSAYMEDFVRRRAKRD